ncbi:MAG: 50S ribosomal protein L32e [Candidatus Methanoperedenaceae archaeon]|nr:MAG: 50S ribosomal protein L32e [Candidatus Methanoperedenaceae archaeon]
MEDEAIKQLTTIEGVGKAKAKILYDAGFKTIESVKKANEDEIADIKGIGEKLAQKIKASADQMVIEEEQAEIIETSPVTITLDTETKRLLNIRKKQKSKKPTFKQTDSHKKKKLADHWRKPDGIHNKTRYSKHGKCPLVEAGYGSPAAVRGLHPSGFEEIIVNNIKEVESLKTDRQAGRIARTVGARKRSLIEKKAAELGLKILNPARKVD